MIRISKVLFVTVVLLISLAVGCELDKTSSSDPGSILAQTATSTSTSAKSAPDLESGVPRVFGRVPRFSLKNENGVPVSGKNLIERAWIATFIFTRCQATCPAQTAEFAKIQAEIEKNDAVKDARLVSITVDPSHDTPAVLKEYARKAGADPDLWTFLTGGREAIWNLSKDGFKLPVSAAQDPNMIVAHSQSFVLVDRLGQIRGFYDGLDKTARQKLMKDLEYVLAHPKWPMWERKSGADDDRPGPTVFQPRSIENPTWMAECAEAQLATRSQFEVYHDFKFTDRLPESGITFMNKIVEDAGKEFKAVHYDHGTGVSVADIDGDGLLDLYFVTQLGANQLVRNLGDGKFEDITASAKVGLGDRVGVSASFADTDNDSDPDLFVTTVRFGNVLFENLGGGKFRDITADSGLGYSGHSSGAVFFDYDRDGLLDLFVCNVGEYTTDVKGPGGYYVGYKDGFFGHQKQEREERSLLYRNLGKNRFEEVSAKLGISDKSWTGDASPVDFNEDGWPDLYVLSMQGHDEYYENVGGTKFVKKSREIFPRTSWGSMGIKVLDFENDGDMDIFITDMHTDMIDDLKFKKRHWWAEKLKMHEAYPDQFLATDLNHVMGNAFFLNDGKGAFEEVSDQNGAETYWPWGLSVGDLNADGWVDAFVTASMNYPYRYGVNSVLLNNRGKKFLDSEFIVGVEPRRDGRTAKPWFELDCDDPANKNFVSSQHCKGREGLLEVYGALGARSSVIFDLDNDGDLDIVTNDFNSEPTVLISDLAQRKTIHYLKVQLAGVKSNRSGLGAKVVVKAGGQSYTKVQDGVSGYLSHSDAPLYFGLGDVAKVDSIEVTWPSSAKQTVSGPINANQLFTVTEK